jgi:hypothetical protein
MNNRFKADFYFFSGIIYFLLFAYYIEKDKDIVTWIFLMISQICFLITLRHWIKLDQENKK